MHATGAAFAITGDAQDPETATDIDLLMSVLPAPFTGEAQIRAPSASAAQNRALDVSPRDVSARDVSPGGVSAARAPACETRLTDAIAAQAIAFASDRSELDAQSRESLGALATLLQACPRYHLRITGHTDSSGNAIRNLLLSEYRAEAVAAYLGALGVASGRFETLGLGDAEPLFDNATLEGRAGNRRIELAAFLPPQSQTQLQTE